MQGSKPRVAGAIFQNTSGRGPEFTGVVEIDGVKTQIALWPKVSAKGTAYLQISEDKKKPQGGASPAAPQRPGGFQPRSPQPQQGYASPKNDMDDDIPFNPEWRG